jgi:CDP-diacylglycerol--serine O-phosphatidyltransferase
MSAASARSRQLVANLLTCCNFSSGIAAIFLPNGTSPARRSTFILLGALCDSLDGSLARDSGYPTTLGAWADGVSDAVTCGIAPAVVLASNRPAPRTALSSVAPAAYLAAIAWRIGRYGIGPRTSHVFRGLPVTGAGVLFALGCQVRMSASALAYWTLALVVAMLSPTRILSGEALLAKMCKRAPSSNWPT